MWLVYTPLLTYKHAEGKQGTELIPGLAEALPAISGDGRTYRLKLRDGLTFSDGTLVKASDFEHTIKRVLNLESPGSSLFLGIAGAQAYAERGEAGGDITGIETDDSTGEITIRLAAPDANFSQALATIFAGVVPSSARFENLTEAPPARGRSLRDRPLPAEPRVRAAPQRGLRHPRDPGREGRSHHGPHHHERRPPGAGRDPWEARLHAGRAAAGPPAARAARPRGPLQGVRDRGHELLLPQHPHTAVRQARRAARREHRPRRACAAPGLRRTARAHLQLPATQHPRLREARPLPLRRAGR